MTAWNLHPVQVREGLTMTGDDLAWVVQSMLKDLNKAVSIPLVVSRAARGDYAPLNRAGPRDSASRQVMSWSIWCNEPWAGLNAKEPWGTEFDSYTAARIAGLRQGCTFMPRRAEPRSLCTFPSSTRVPVLAFAGGADPQDPISNLPERTPHFPGSRAVILPHTGHQFGAPVGEITADFVDHGTTKGLNTTRCAGAIVVPPFTLPG